MSIVDTIYSYLPPKRKQTPSSWTKFNAVCCSHNGSTVDTRQRGGMIRNSDGVSYHCFNCGYKASYVAGRHLTRKMRNLLSWMGVPDDTISKLSLEAMKIESDQQQLEAISLPTLPDKPLPDDCQLILDAASQQAQALAAAEYILDRNFKLDDYPWMWSPTMPDRFVMPFIYQGRIVGWTGRKITEGKPKYLSDQTPGYVFNLDAQINQRPYVLVVEGPLDAISVGGVAILSADIMDKQAMLINQLGKRPVLIPDRDKDGARTVEQAIELGWAVSMPQWDPGVKDVNDAVRHYGRLATLYKIIQAKEETSLKIQLAAKQWFKNI